MKSVKFRSALIFMTLILAFVPSVAYAKTKDAPVSLDELLINTSMIEAIASGSHETVPDDGLTKSKDKNNNGDIVVQWASGGLGATHQYLTSRALEILKADKGTATANLLYAYGSTILSYSDWPDSYETNLFTFSGHFYDPATGKNYLGQTNPTALTRFKDHAAKAKSYYSSNKTASMQELGKAIHYLADAGTPHHSANLTALNSNHTQYENWVNANDNFYQITTGTKYSYLVPSNISKDYAIYCGNILIDTAKFSKGYIGQAKSADQLQWATSADATLKRSQDIMAAFLYNFLRSVGAIS